MLAWRGAVRNNEQVAGVAPNRLRSRPIDCARGPIVCAAGPIDCARPNRLRTPVILLHCSASGGEGAAMRITRCDLRAWREGTEGSPSEWPALADTPLAAAGEEVEIDWYGYRAGSNPGYLTIQLNGVPPEEAGAAPTAGATGYRYEVFLRGKEVGAVLAEMPPEAVADVVGEFLRGVDPEVLGAVVGRLLAHVAQAAASRARKPDV